MTRRSVKSAITADILCLRPVLPMALWSSITAESMSMLYLLYNWQWCTGVAVRDHSEWHALNFFEVLIGLEWKVTRFIKIVFYKNSILKFSLLYSMRVVCALSDIHKVVPPASWTLLCSRTICKHLFYWMKLHLFCSHYSFVVNLLRTLNFLC